MNEKKDFLLTHYHDDHFNGAIYMATTTPHRFNDVYISDVWNMPGSVYVTSLTLLRGIFTKSVILGKNTIIDFLETICNEMGIAQKNITPEALQALKSYEWTGNIRELRNVVERLIILGSPTITAEEVSMYK